MRISTIGIANFANFRALDIRTGENIVVVGENKVGKSNFSGITYRHAGGERNLDMFDRALTFDLRTAVQNSSTVAAG